MKSLPHLLSALFLVFLLCSCGKPKEVPYSKLGYADNLFTDPDTGKGFSGIARDYHKNGQLKAEFPFKNGRFHGNVKEWHPNGKPMAETEFKDGERCGRNIEWTEAGLPYRERVYDHDKILQEKNYEPGK